MRDRAAVGILGVVLALLAARVVYLVWLSPYELVSDEAQYWDWSRRLAPSYYTKGPGVAWLIAASTAGFGAAEWAIRLPAACAAAVAAVAVAALARATVATPGPEAAATAVVAVLLFTLTPPYQLTAILMTVDGPYLAAWAVAAWAGWRLVERRRDGRATRGSWMLLAAALGVGCLVKYTILLLVPGLVWFAWAERRGLAWDRHAARDALLAGMVWVVIVSPMIVWNVRHEWAGVRHVLGLMTLPGGDQPDGRLLRLDPMATVELVGTQLGLVGPFVLLAVLGLSRRWSPLARDVWRPGAVRYLVAAAVPTLGFFLVLSIRSSVEGNWPIAAYLTLLVPAAAAIVSACRPGRVRGLEAAPAAARRVRRWAAVAVVYGGVAAAGIHAPLAAARVPGLDGFVPTHRFVGLRARAAALAVEVERQRRVAPTAFVVALSHNEAGFLAYYLPGRPVVASAGRARGLRPSAYDFFPDTALDAPALLGRPGLLLEGGIDTWRSALRFTRYEPTETPGVVIGLGYVGPP